MPSTRRLPGVKAKQGPHGLYFVRDQDASLYTETKRIVERNGEPVVKTTTCCCRGPGLTPRGCSDAAGNKTPCRCDCHRKK